MKHPPDAGVRLIDTVEGRRALWNRISYDVSVFEPGRAEADSHVFIEVEPHGAIVLGKYGLEGRDTWTAT